MADNNYQPDQILGHGDEYDGIEEYDNRLPAWWVWLFYLTIAGGVWMLADWHLVSPKTLGDLYDVEMAAAAEMYEVLEPVEVVINDANVARGAEVWETNCVACHAADGTGGVGPDLTDAEWIHGGTIADINHTIFYGVPEKGMLAWGEVIGPEDVSAAAAYVVATFESNTDE